MPFLGGRASASRGFFGGGSTPTAPTNLSSIEGNQQLTISFDAPSFNGGLNISNYEYALSTNSGSSYGAWTPLSPVDTSSPIIIGGLTNGQEYYVKLRAANPLGGGASSTPLSTNTTPYTVPGKPTITGLTPGNGQVYVEYSAPASNGGRAITGYSIQYSSNGGSTWSSPVDSGNDLNHTVTGLSNGTGYVFRVYARNIGGDGLVSDTSSSSTPRTVPDQVGTPTSSAGDRRFTISWSAPGNGGSAITGYRVQYSTDNGNSWTGDATTTSTSYTFTLENQTSYVGRVQAYNIAGDGAYSDKSTARTPNFAAPTINSVTVTQEPIIIEWNGYDDQNTWYKRPFRVTYSPTACENYSRTEVSVTLLEDEAGSAANIYFYARTTTTYSSAANQTFDINYIDGIFGSTTIGIDTSYLITVTTYNSADKSVSASTYHSTSDGVSINRESGVLEFTTNAIRVTGGSSWFTREYFDWWASATESVRSADVYVKGYSTTSYRVSSSRNPLLWLSSNTSSTGSGGDSVSIRSLKGADWPAGTSYISETWNHTDLNTAYNGTTNSQRYSVGGGGGITGDWVASEEVGVYLVVKYRARYTYVV